MYTGQTSDLRHRCGKHFSQLRLGNHPSKLFQDDFNNFGTEAFSVHILKKVQDKDMLLEWEKFFVLRNKTMWYQYGYNRGQDFISHNGRYNSNYGRRWGEDLRKEVSDIVKQRMNDPVWRETQKEIWAKKGEITSKFWRENPSALEEMARKVGEAVHKYGILKVDDNSAVIDTYPSVEVAQEQNDKIQWQNVYNSANGFKRKHQGYYWLTVVDEIQNRELEGVIKYGARLLTMNMVENRSEVMRKWKAAQSIIVEQKLSEDDAVDLLYSWVEPVIRIKEIKLKNN